MLQQPAHVFYGHAFSEITPPDVREADVAQAKLVMEGKIDSYLMHKSYEFPNGKEKKVTLLVTRVPINVEKPFKYFLSRILLREEKPSNVEQSSLIHHSKDGTNDKWATIIGFVVRYWLGIAVGSAALFGIINEFFQMGFF